MFRSKIRFSNTKSLTIILLAVLAFFQGCKEDGGEGFTVDFTYEIQSDRNKVVFTNTSEGEYYSLAWDFANGQTVSSTEKSKQYTIYYPKAGDYTVTLSALNFTGDSKQVSKTVTIDQDDFALSFTATINTAQPNYVTLVNTSTGSFDSFKWIFNNDEVENENTTEAYFPLAGTYEIVFQATIGSETLSTSQSVTIAADDPTYTNDYQLVWADEFDASTVNTTNWTFETGAGGWGNAELQNYTSGNNAEIVDGKLVITAKKVDDNQVAGSYTSTRMITKGKKEFTYGKMEIRAKLPSGTGIWPAIWMLGGNISSVGWPACGEIDIMEYVGYQPDVVHATVHTTAGSGGNGDGSSKTLTTAEEEFHVYGLIWDSEKLVFYTDTPENVTHTYSPAVKTAENWPFDKPQFFILNVAVGGTWGGVQGIDNSIFPQQMEVDYVRVYQKN